MKPLHGHPYHAKTDAMLEYIIKDAGDAALCMRGVSAKAEAKYLDQVNDACTVLHYRKNMAAAKAAKAGFLKLMKGATQ
jgi:hypothetical protein